MDSLWWILIVFLVIIILGTLYLRYAGSYGLTQPAMPYGIPMPTPMHQGAVPGLSKVSQSLHQAAHSIGRTMHGGHDDEEESED
ncbi:MAG: hypothetical protein ACYCQJ_16235 [Nitrososphaerales archaeon]